MAKRASDAVVYPSTTRFTWRLFPLRLEISVRHLGRDAEHMPLRVRNLTCIVASDVVPFQKLQNPALDEQEPVCGLCKLSTLADLDVWATLKSVLPGKQGVLVYRVASRTDAIQVGTVNQRSAVEIVAQCDEIVIALVPSRKPVVGAHRRGQVNGPSSTTAATGRG